MASLMTASMGSGSAHSVPAKSIPDPTNLYLDHMNDFLLKINIFSLTKMHLKIRLPNINYFVQFQLTHCMAT